MKNNAIAFKECICSKYSCYNSFGSTFLLLQYIKKTYGRVKKLNPL